MTTSNLRTKPAWSDPALRRRHIVDLLCRDFEELWHAGQKSDPDVFLQNVDPHLHQDLLPELVAAEWELRTLAGSTPDRGDYISRYPQLASLLSELEATDFHTRDSAVQSSATAWPQHGEEFCGYRIIRELGRGAMGTVFLAEVPVIGHQVALKVLEISLRESHVAISRFEREAKLLSKLDHPGIVPLYSYGESQGLRYLVMKAINGVSMASVIAGSDSSASSLQGVGPQDSTTRSEQWLSIARQLAEALEAVHSAEVLHRDIKPSNILLTNSGQVFLTDFSLARIESAGLDITRSDEFVGTLRYCAPESLDGVYSKQGDIYSLGLVLFELFSLTTPFAANSRRELLNKKLSGLVPEMASCSGAIPKPYLQILQRMTAYDAADRYQSANEVLEAFELLKEPVVKPPGISRRRLILLAVFGLLAITAGLLAKITSPTDNTNVEQGDLNERPTAESQERRSRENSITAPINPSLLFALGSSMSQSEPGDDQWLIPERQFELPRKTPVSLVSLSDDGSHVIFVMMGASLFMGAIDAERLPIMQRPYQSEIVAADQSESGDYLMLVNRDPGRPSRSGVPVTDSAAPEYFIEVHSRQREKWLRISGPLFHLAHGMPGFIPGPHPHNKREILVPEPDSPIILHPHTAGYQHVLWPEGPRAAISCYFDMGIAAMQDGRVVLFPLGFQDFEGKQAPTRTIKTPIRDFQSVHPSPNGRLLVLIGKTEACIVSLEDALLLTTFDVSHFENPRLSFSADGRWLAFAASNQVQTLDLATQKWHGNSQRTDSELLMALPLSNSLLTVERSGLVRQTPLDPEYSQHAREFQCEKLSAASMSVPSRRLALATEMGRVLFFRVP